MRRGTLEEARPVTAAEKGRAVAASGERPPLVESKLRPPWSRPGVVPRDALVDHLEAMDAPIVAVSAPTGYGKTTLLAQWAERTSLPVAWLTLDAFDRDPAVLLGYLVAVLGGLDVPDGAMLRSLAAEGAQDIAWSLRRLAAVTASIRSPFLLVLDNVELVGPRSADLIGAVALHLPAGARVALACRADPPLPMANLRAGGLVEELGPDALAMDDREAGELLAGVATPLPSAEVRALVESTEGWPAGLYLASLVMRGRPESGSPPTAALLGSDRVVTDYIRTEVLSTLAPSTVTFLIRTSVLERLSGPLCDAVLAATGSQAALEQLEASNLLLVPLDRQRRWYRYHHLLAELLRAELDRTEPELVSRLHDRAAAWFEAHGELELAIDHAQAAGDTDRAARLVGLAGQQAHIAGRSETVRRWVGWFEERGVLEQYPHVPAAGALVCALTGERAQAEVLADAAAAGDRAALAPDGSPVEAWVALVQACLARDGIARMGEDASRAAAKISRSSPFLGPAHVLGGFAARMAGTPDADDLLAVGAELCLRYGGAPTGAAALAERAALAIEQGDWARAGEHSDEAVAVAHARQLHVHAQLTGVFAVAARVSVGSGDVRQGRSHVMEAARARPRCTAAIPWSALFLVQLAHAYLALADAAGARAVLRQVRDIMHVRPDLGTVLRGVADLEHMLDTMRVGSVGASSLTAAELRLLPLLATHLSYRDIGERLYVSRNTVKSQAISVFRKLSVSSRTDAVDAAEQIGLLGR